MYRRPTFLTAAGVLLSTSLLSGQHPGHTTETNNPPAARQQLPTGEQPSVREGVSAIQRLFRELEKATRPWHANRFQDAATRYEASIDSLVRSVGEGSRGDEVYLKNLELAAKSLDRQARQLQQLAYGAPPEASESLNRLIDGVDLARDDVSTRQVTYRDSEGSGGAAHDTTHSSAGHGCGSGRSIWRLPR